MPPGVATATEVPSSLPINALAIGDAIDMRPNSRLASYGPTI